MNYAKKRAENGVLGYFFEFGTVDGSDIAYSYDGANWTSSVWTLGYSTAIIWGRDKFVAVGIQSSGSSVTDTVYWSGDGIKWYGSNPFGAAQTYGGHGITWYRGMFVAVGFVANSSSGCSLLYSSDGVSWTHGGLESNSTSSAILNWEWNDVAWVGDKFLAVGNVASGVME